MHKRASTNAFFVHHCMHKIVSAGHFANGRKYPALIMRNPKNLFPLLPLRQLFACGNGEGGEEFVVIFTSAIAKNFLRSGSGNNGMEKGNKYRVTYTFCIFLPFFIRLIQIIDIFAPN